MTGPRSRHGWFCVALMHVSGCVLASGCTLELETTSDIGGDELLPGDPEKPVTAPRGGGHRHPCAGAQGLDSDRPFHAPSMCIVAPPLSTGRPDPTDVFDPVGDTVLPDEATVLPGEATVLPGEATVLPGEDID